MAASTSSSLDAQAAEWTRIPLPPEPEDLAAAWAIRGDDSFVAGSKALAALLDHAAGPRPVPTRDELALALTAAGSVPLALELLIAARTAHREGSQGTS